MTPKLNVGGVLLITLVFVSLGACKGTFVVNVKHDGGEEGGGGGDNVSLSISSVSPTEASEPEEGGDTLVVSGAGIKAGATVKIVQGSTELNCAGATVDVAAQTITCTTPTPAVAGAATVRVTNPDAVVATLADAFDYRSFCGVYGSESPWAGSSSGKGGDGSESNPFRICTYGQLDAIRNNMGNDGNGGARPDTYFKLMGDIDVAGQGFVSIGHDSCGSQDAFAQGGLDGNDKTIANLTVPLFLNVCREAWVRNLKLRDVNINMSSTDYVGALARRWNPNAAVVISNIEVSGSVVGKDWVGGIFGNLDPENGSVPQSRLENARALVDVSGASEVGGLSGGINLGFIVRDSYATGDVTYSNQKGGGFVGSVGAWYGADPRTLLIERSWATGDVRRATPSAWGPAGGFVASIAGPNGTITLRRNFSTGAVGTASSSGNAEYLGGFVAFLESVGATIEDCYTSSDVKSPDNAGGFVDRLVLGTIRRSYANGMLDIASNKRGFMSDAWGGVQADNFWDVDRTSASSDASGSTATGLNAADMHDQTKFTNWDFSGGGVWVMPTTTTGPTHGAPMLRGVTPGA
jgi:hypothetical protein